MSGDSVNDFVTKMSTLVSTDSLSSTSSPAEVIDTEFTLQAEFNMPEVESSTLTKIEIVDFSDNINVLTVSFTIRETGEKVTLEPQTDLVVTLVPGVDITDVTITITPNDDTMTMQFNVKVFVCVIYVGRYFYNNLKKLLLRFLVEKESQSYL